MKFLELDTILICIRSMYDYLSFDIRRVIVSSIPVAGYLVEVKFWGFLLFFTGEPIFTYIIFRFDFDSYLDL